MKVEILTPEKRIFEGDVDVLTVPTATGYISVMSDHTPLVLAVGAGKITVKTKNGEKAFENEKGVLQTINNRTVLLLRKCREK
jgi:F-type H+-transporting ATPase subunit epsilon